MTYTEYTEQTNAQSRVLVELDIGSNNVQWVNAGAGIWMIDLDNVYDVTMFVDSSLIPAAWLSLNYPDIGSVLVDGVPNTETTDLATVTTTNESWYWDESERQLFVHIINNARPEFHNITIGVVYGYSDTEFTPVGAEQLYQGRLLDLPNFGSRRDPLFFGRLTFPGFTLSLANGDGHFDLYGRDFDVYGQTCRVYHGYAVLDKDDYQLLYTGAIETFTVGEERAEFAIVDKRAQLTKPTSYECTDKNALDAIVELLLDEYGTTYDTTFYDTTAWAAAQSEVPNITIDMDLDGDGDKETMKVIDLIEDICKAVFGFFFITSGGKYSFKIVDTSATSETTIQAVDIINRNTITYNPTEVISSVRIGYGETATGYSYYTDTSRQAEVFNQYKIYNQQEYETYLPTASAATVLATTILDYTEDVHGGMELQVPMKYYARAVGETVDVEIQRTTTDMLGTVKSEITSVDYELQRPGMKIGVRFV